MLPLSNGEVVIVSRPYHFHSWWPLATMKETLRRRIMVTSSLTAKKKRGGLKVEAIHRSSFKLFTMTFSKKTPFCERAKTTQ
jgi:hypothetical protein